MKVVILAGGFGTRISEESHLKPKPMVEIGGKPILWHIMKDLIKLMNPKYIEVTGIFTPRGGISIYPYANYGRPGTKFEQMAEHRLMNRE